MMIVISTHLIISNACGKIGLKIKNIYTNRFLKRTMAPRQPNNPM